MKRIDREISARGFLAVIIWLLIKRRHKIILPLHPLRFGKN